MRVEKHGKRGGEGQIVWARKIQKEKKKMATHS